MRSISSQPQAGQRGGGGGAVSGAEGAPIGGVGEAYGKPRDLVKITDFILSNGLPAGGTGHERRKSARLVA